MLLWDCEKAGYKRYRFVTEGDSCELCSSLDGQIFDIKDAKSGVNLAPMHPNCDCSAAVLDENGEIVLAIGGKNSENLDGRFVRISNNLNEILNEFYRAKVVLHKKFGVGNKNEYMDIGSPGEAEDKYILSEDDYKLVKVYTQLFHYFDTFGEIEKRDAVRLAIVRIRQKDEYKNRYSETMSDGVYVDGYRYSSKVKEVNVSGVVMTEGYAYSLGGKNLKNDLFMKMITKFDKDCRVMFWEKN